MLASTRRKKKQKTAHKIALSLDNRGPHKCSGLRRLRRHTCGRNRPARAFPAILLGSPGVVVTVPAVVLLHFLQSGKHGARVLDEYSTRTTTTRLWGRVSGSPAPGGLPPGAAPITAAGR